MSKITIEHIKAKKTKASPITMLTAYDHPCAKIIDDVEIDIILVGDSLANVVLGLESTKAVTMEQMISHAMAVRRAVKRSLLVGDMPFESCQPDMAGCIKNAKRFIDEAGCDAVKVEWSERSSEIIKNIIDEGIQVMGHIGLTPQTADKLGGFKVQGRDAESANKLLVQARVLEGLGVFSIVLECIPDSLADKITKSLSIPTIGIGAGPCCDGQVLVLNDILGLSGGFRPKFVKRYADVAGHIKTAVEQYKFEVENKIFPAKEHSYGAPSEEAVKLKSENPNVKVLSNRTAC